MDTSHQQHVLDSDDDADVQSPRQARSSLNPAARPYVQQQPVKIKLADFWKKDVISWFALAESTFRRYGVRDKQFMFDLVLPSLPDDALEHVKSVLRAAYTSADPYVLLKERLIQLYSPDDLDLTYKILNTSELGDRKPSQLMESMLALLPTGETDGLLFKGIFLSRLPVDIRDNVSTQWRAMDSRALAAYADTLWTARRIQAGTVIAPLAAGDELEDLVDSVAALNVQKQSEKKPRYFKKKAGDKKDGKARFHCFKHHTFGKKARACSDPANCTWAENE